MTAIHVEHEGRVYVLGRHLEPNHDERNREFPAAVAPLNKVEWARHGGPFDQGQLGSCTGNALAGWFNTEGGGYSPLRALMNEKDAVRFYSEGTHLDGFPGTYLPTDTGCDGPSVCKAAKKEGKLGGYRHTFGIDHFLGALMHGPVMAGTGWTQSMFTADSSGVVKPSGSFVGGHEYEAVSYDPATGLVGFWNSWGTSWAAGGRFWMHADDFASLLAKQGDGTVPHL